MSPNYQDNQAQIIIPANVVTELAKALQEERSAQRQHEMQMAGALLAFAASAADKFLTFAREEAAQRRAANTAELREEVEALRNELNGWRAQG